MGYIRVILNHAIDRYMISLLFLSQLMNRVMLIFIYIYNRFPQMFNDRKHIIDRFMKNKILIMHSVASIIYICSLEEGIITFKSLIKLITVPVNNKELIIKKIASSFLMTISHPTNKYFNTILDTLFVIIIKNDLSCVCSLFQTL